MVMREQQYESGDNYDYTARSRSRRSQLPPTVRQATTSTRGRSLGGADQATVAIAMTGMAFYWLMPAMMSRGRPRRRLRRRGTPRTGGGAA